MAPHRLFKGTTTDGGIKVAAFASGFGVKAKGSWADTNLTAMDMMPTMLDLAGIKHPSALGVTVLTPKGKSFASQVWGNGAPARGANDAMVWEFNSSKAVVRGDWKLLYVNQPRNRSAGWELFNIRSDPGETSNMASAMPEKVTELAAIYDAYAAEVGVIDRPEGPRAQRREERQRARGEDGQEAQPLTPEERQKRRERRQQRRQQGSE
jgi:arylsulfatase A-like enzyme